MNVAWLSAALVISNLVTVDSFMHFQEAVPNGDHVPHPCKPNFMWRGVGHEQRAGGGSRNQFGRDFLAAGMTWTETLCRQDSDGDGTTNGEELGDPDCTWTPGEIPSRVTGISHPGVCTPWGSPQCRDNDPAICEDAVFDCPAIQEEGVKELELVIPPTNIPAFPTNYFCMTFELPEDGDFHIIATTPIINETRVMHHLGLMGCDDDAPMYDSPVECAMGYTGCNRLLSVWTLGLPGECFYKEAGLRMGRMGYKKGALQFHWTNPELRSDLWDASGMKLYYTSSLRKHDAGTWFVGQTYLEIPPRTDNVVQQAECSGRCTRKLFNETIYLISGLNHMHYLGVAERNRLIRSNGESVELTNEPVYSYDTPVVYKYDPPVAVHPGDSIETVCTFRSMSRTHTTVWGRGTFDEMCYGIFSYYPAAAIPYSECVMRKEFEECDYKQKPCDYDALVDLGHTETRALIDRVMAACSYEEGCLNGCRQVINDILTTHPCFKDGLAHGVTYRKIIGRASDKLEALRWVVAMKSCDCPKENPIVYQDPLDIGLQDYRNPDEEEEEGGPTSSAIVKHAPGSVVALCSLIYCILLHL